MLRTIQDTRLTGGGALRGPGWSGDLRLRIAGQPFPNVSASAPGEPTRFGPFTLGTLEVERQVDSIGAGLRYVERVRNLGDHPAELVVEVVGTSLGAVEAAETGRIGTPGDRWVLTDGVLVVPGGGPRASGSFLAGLGRGLPEGGQRQFRYGWRLRLEPGQRAAMVHVVAPGADAAMAGALLAALGEGLPPELLAEVINLGAVG